MANQPFTRWRQFYGSRCPVEQRLAQDVLQSTDLLANGRLRRVQMICSRGKTACISNCHKGMEKLGIEHNSIIKMNNYYSIILFVDGIHRH